MIYLIYNLKTPISVSNIKLMNAKCEDLNFDTSKVLLWDDFVNARKESIGSQFGYPKYKDGVLIHVLPFLVDFTNLNPLEIKAVTKEDYKTNYLPTFDVIEDEETN